MRQRVNQEYIVIGKGGFNTAIFTIAALTIASIAAPYVAEYLTKTFHPESKQAQAAITPKTGITESGQKITMNYEYYAQRAKQQAQADINKRGAIHEKVLSFVVPELALQDRAVTYLKKDLAAAGYTQSQIKEAVEGFRTESSITGWVDVGSYIVPSATAEVMASKGAASAIAKTGVKAGLKATGKTVSKKTAQELAEAAIKSAGRRGSYEIAEAAIKKTAYEVGETISRKEIQKLAIKSAAKGTAAATAKAGFYEGAVTMAVSKSSQGQGDLLQRQLQPSNFFGLQLPAGVDIALMGGAGALTAGGAGYAIGKTSAARAIAKAGSKAEKTAKRTQRGILGVTYALDPYELPGDLLGGLFKGRTKVITPSITPTKTQTPKGTPTPTPGPTFAPEAIVYTPSPTPVPVEIFTPSFVPTPSPTPVPVPVPTFVPTPTPVPTPVPVPTPTPTETPSPTPSPAFTPTPTPTTTPTPVPVPTPTPTPFPRIPPFFPPIGGPGAPKAGAKKGKGTRYVDEIRMAQKAFFETLYL